MKNIIIKCVMTLATSGMLLTSCDIMNNSSKGYLAGSVGGTILGAGIGAAIGGDYGAGIGANLGMAVGGVAGAAIGAEQDAKEMGKQQNEYLSSSITNAKDYSNSYYDKETGQIYTKVSDDNSILFSSRSSELNDASIKEIFKIATNLRGIQFGGIVIYGSTDDTESRDYSYELSLDRANMVGNYFADLGFDEKMIHIIGLGNDFPVSDNSTFDGRAKNRCVEVYVVNGNK